MPEKEDARLYGRCELAGKTVWVRHHVSGPCAEADGDSCFRACDHWRDVEPQPQFSDHGDTHSHD